MNRAQALKIIEWALGPELQKFAVGANLYDQGIDEIWTRGNIESAGCVGHAGTDSISII